MVFIYIFFFDILFNYQIKLVIAFLAICYDHIKHIKLKKSYYNVLIIKFFHNQYFSSKYGVNSGLLITQKSQTHPDLTRYMIFVVICYITE